MMRHGRNLAIFLFFGLVDVRVVGVLTIVASQNIMATFCKNELQSAISKGIFGNSRFHCFGFSMECIRDVDGVGLALLRGDRRCFWSYRPVGPMIEDFSCHGKLVHR